MITEILKMFPLFLLSCFKFAFGVPAAFWAFNFNFWECFLFGLVSGMSGVVISIYMSHSLLILWIKIKNLFTEEKIKTDDPDKVFNTKKFTKGNRFYVKIIKKYGLAGIAFLSPTIISIPVGSLLATKIYGKGPKVLIYMSISVLFWSAAFSFTLILF